jgi:hypothetical protein
MPAVKMRAVKIRDEFPQRKIKQKQNLKQKFNQKINRSFKPVTDGPFQDEKNKLIVMRVGKQA